MNSFHQRSYHYTFVLVDQQDDIRQRQNIEAIFTPNGREEFKKPRQRENRGRGNPQFVKHSTLRTRQYVRVHAVFVKILVDPWKITTIIYFVWTLTRIELNYIQPWPIQKRFSSALKCLLFKNWTTKLKINIVNGLSYDIRVILNNFELPRNM
jgi:hypothetical protein